MDFQSINKGLSSKLRARGYAARVIPIHRLENLKDEIEHHYQQGMFNAQFFQERLAHFDFDQPIDMPEAKSIIIVAIPSPQIGVLFHWNGESKTLILPPTYVGYSTLPVKMEILVNEVLNPMGYRAMKTLNLPIKPLAVHSRLAEYGRNNITYVEGMGSFHHLFTFYSDMPCEQDDWREMKMLERCAHCRACIIKCPTGAIGEDRFLLRAERCLSFHNEKLADVPFPAWIDSSWHNSIYGCMLCQRYCPEDKKFKDWVETRAEFSLEETALLLGHSSNDSLSAAIMEKLDRLELIESLDVLPRNLGVLLNRE
ncbi:MAG TPA: 4Fe-4S double cluster binding domain-containing protein [Anaerolineales bacterium]|nr:4Fe-4S double cluster binding domain-containing protein [Anaerolineales bacterium]